MIAGFAVTVLWVEFFKAGFYDLYEMIPGFVAGMLACVAISLLTEPDADAVAELESVREEVGPVF
jgi:sodium/proline symporter